MSAADVTEQWLARIAQCEPAVGAFVSVDADGARAAASALDAALDAGAPPGPLAGVPVAVKDTLATAGLRTTAGSKALRGHVPAYDAVAVARLRAAGAIVVGKANCDEFAMGSTTETSATARTVNPWDAARAPGGSSGGSAAAVAARATPAALGSDTGGSIRQPASYCGVVGVKPTYGLVPRAGLLAYASSLDCVGPLAVTVRDAAALLTVIAGPCVEDATASARARVDYLAALPPTDALDTRPLAGVTAAVLDTGAGLAPGVAAAFEGAVAHVEALGARVTRVALPSLAAALPAYYVIALSEASSNLARYDGVRYGSRGEAEAESAAALISAARAAGLGPEVKRRILMGTYALSAGYVDAYYTRAQRVRAMVAAELAAALDVAAGGATVLLAPAAPSAAPLLGAAEADPLAMYLSDVLTVPVNLGGLPGVCVPCGADGGMPVGLQIVAGAHRDADALRVAHAFEVTADFARLGRAPLAATL